MFSYIVFLCLDIPVKHSLSLFIYYLIYVFWQEKEHLEYSEQPKAIFCKNGRKVYFYFIFGKISHD
jgi:hypothetical protein